MCQIGVVTTQWSTLEETPSFSKINTASQVRYHCKAERKCFAMVYNTIPHFQINPEKYGLQNIQNFLWGLYVLESEVVTLIYGHKWLIKIILHQTSKFEVVVRHAKIASSISYFKWPKCNNYKKPNSQNALRQKLNVGLVKQMVCTMDEEVLSHLIKNILATNFTKVCRKLEFKLKKQELLNSLIQC